MSALSGGPAIAYVISFNLDISNHGKGSQWARTRLLNMVTFNAASPPGAMDGYSNAADPALH
eukprot:9946051-Karenia_brevis.AAC.1